MIQHLFNLLNLGGKEGEEEAISKALLIIAFLYFH